MFQEIYPHIYHNEFSKKPAEPGDHILVFSREGLLSRMDGQNLILPTLAQLGEAYAGSQHLFSIDETHYYLHEGDAPAAPEGWSYCSTRPLRESCVPDEHLFAAAAAESLWRWYSGNRFCGRCGSKMVHGTTEKNTGKYDGYETVQLYIRDVVTPNWTRPVKELKGFKKVFIKAGESAEVEFEITPEMLSWYEVDQYNMSGSSKPLSAKLVLEPGDFMIMAGPNSRDTQAVKLTVK